jgi:hypothetical protein
VLSVFDQSTITGQTLRRVIENIFGPLGSQAEGAGVIVKRVLQGMIIGALYVELAFFKVRNALYRAFGQEAFQNLGLAQRALQLSAGFATVFAGQLILAAAAATALGLAILKLPEIVTSVWNTIKTAFGDSFRAAHAKAGANIIEGLVEGLLGGAGALYSAIKNVASKALAVFKDTFGIHSPSRIMRIQGRFLPMGAALGVKDEGPRFQRAVAQMGGPGVDLSGIGNMSASIGAAVGARLGPGQQASSGGAPVLHFGDIIVQGGGREGAADFRRQLARELEGVNIRLGGAAV